MIDFFYWYCFIITFIILSINLNNLTFVTVLIIIDVLWIFIIGMTSISIILFCDTILLFFGIVLLCFSAIEFCYSLIIFILINNTKE